MLPSEKKLYVRGLLCGYCNLRLLPKGMTAEKAERIHNYLSEWNSKKP
jgi:hypothetical protein